MYEFVYDKVIALKIKTSVLMNLNEMRYLYQDIEVEKSDMGVKSIDVVKREIAIDVTSE